MVEKPVISADEAAAKIREGDTLMVGGFLGCGSPPDLIDALERSGAGSLTLVCNDTGVHNLKTGACYLVAKLVAGKRFKKIIVSHIGTNGETQRQMNEGETEVVLVPQGTLAERIRSAGAGLGGILTPTGIGTEVQEGKQVLESGGRKFLLETALPGDVALIKARKADKAGNLVYDKCARNFNPLMAMACRTVIAEADEIVEIGQIDPETVVTPSVFVDYLVWSGKRG
ncbi:MAG TPA: CoA transferase subunit A [Magnetospirillaceae bacterium]|nr:CoA transferase subunit A [Magnetospirillaceae bacterium]